MKRLSLPVLLLAGAAFLGASCRDSNAVASAAPSARARPEFRKGKVYVSSSQGGELALDVEIAETDGQRAHGLMFKEKLADTEGMIFLFDETREHNFWMKNTPLPLDMIFIGEDRKVVGIYENAQPLSTARMTVGKPSRYVLEVNGGWSRAHGVGPGSQVRFQGIER